MIMAEGQMLAVDIYNLLLIVMERQANISN